MDTPKQLSLFEWARRAVAAPAKPQEAPLTVDRPSMDTLQRELNAARQELHNLQVMALRPDQSPERLDMLRKLELSCRAEIKLRRKAIKWSLEQVPEAPPPNI